MDKLIETTAKNMNTKIPIIHIDQYQYLIGTKIVNCEKVSQDVFVDSQTLSQYIAFIEEQTMTELGKTLQDGNSVSEVLNEIIEKHCE